MIHAGKGIKSGFEINPRLRDARLNRGQMRVERLHEFVEAVGVDEPAGGAACTDAGWNVGVGEAVLFEHAQMGLDVIARDVEVVADGAGPFGRVFNEVLDEPESRRV